MAEKRKWTKPAAKPAEPDADDAPRGSIMSNAKAPPSKPSRAERLYRKKTVRRG